MQTVIQHLYKRPHESDGLLYAWFASMHTRVDIVLCSRKTEEELMLVVHRIYDTLLYLEKIANYYDPISELAKVNRTASISPVILGDELYTMIDSCLKYNKKTLGCFDITVHSENYNQDTIHSVCLSPAERSVFFRQAGVTMNLSGFLKGYALDAIRKIVNESQIEDALINMGNSSVLALGNHPAGKGWMINFDNGMDSVGGDVKQPNILLHNECLTTSGNDTPERKHILSPQNGKWVEGVRRVAVVTNNGTIGEILSTSLFVADEVQCESLLASFQPLLYLQS